MNKLLKGRPAKDGLPLKKELFYSKGQQERNKKNPSQKKYSEDFDDNEDEIDLFKKGKIEENEKDEESFSAEYTKDVEDSLRLFLNDLSEYKLLTPEEERDYLERYHLYQDETAKEKLVLHNMRLVISIAKKYYRKNSSLDFSDIIQSGVFGLINAIEKFKIETSNKLSTYATFWIHQQIGRSISNSGRIIRIPVNMQEKYNKIQAFTKRFFVENERDPTEEEIAKEFGFSKKKVKDILHFFHQTDPLSLNQDFGSSDSKNNPYGISPSLENIAMNQDSKSLEEEVEERDRKRIVRECLCQHLNERELMVIFCRYGMLDEEPMNLDKVGKQFSLSKERIRQIEQKALSKLRECDILKELIFTN